MNIRQKKNLKQEIKEENLKKTEGRDFRKGLLLLSCPWVRSCHGLWVMEHKIQHILWCPTDTGFLFSSIWSAHMATGKCERQRKGKKSFKLPTVKWELLERSGLQGTEGLHKELRVLPYLFGIRGDAPNEEGMAPTKQKEEFLITLFSVLTWEDFTLLWVQQSAQCRDGTKTISLTFSAWLWGPAKTAGIWTPVWRPEAWALCLWPPAPFVDYRQL